MSHADRTSFTWSLSRKTLAAPCAALTLQKQVLLNTWQHQSSQQHSSTRPPLARGLGGLAGIKSRASCRHDSVDTGLTSAQLVLGLVQSANNVQMDSRHQCSSHSWQSPTASLESWHLQFCCIT